MLVGLLAGVAWFAAFWLAHVGLFHTRVIRKRFQAIVRLFGGAALGAVVSAGAASAAGLAAPTAGLLVAAIALVTMACLFVLYMPFYYAVATSQSMGTLIAVEQAPERGLPVEQLIAERASEAMLTARLDSMVANGNLARDGAAYRVTPKGRRIARTFATLQALWQLGPGG